VLLDGRPQRVAGILPRWFRPALLNRVRDLEIWAPKVVQDFERTSRRTRHWNVVARVRPNLTLEAAQTELTSISTQLAKDYPQTMGGMVATLEPFRRHLAGAIREPLIILFAAVVLVLFITCANVASLLLARGAERRREFALRVAIGAGRWRLIRQLLVESLVLGMLAATVGLLIAHWGLDAFMALRPPTLSQMDRPPLDGRVLTFALVLTVGTAVLFGLWPALALTQSRHQSHLNDARSGSAAHSGRSHFTRVLVVTEVALALVLTTVPIYLGLGSEFMPPLWEGSILYMPTTLPGISVTEAQRLLQTQDQILKGFPEVERVFGKAGRIESSTDPAPFSMMETVVLLKPESQWRTKNGRRISHQELIAEMDAALKIPGTTNAWTMPIKNRIDMLTTGVRTPIGIKILGSDLKKIEEIGIRLEGILKDVPGTRSIYAERVAGGYFLDFDLRREELARYGLSIADAQMIVLSAIGGENITTTVEGRERYPVNVRYARELRDDVEELKRVLVPIPSGGQIPLGQIADIVLRSGPAMIRNENGLLAGYVFVDMTGRDIGRYVEEAKRVVAEKLSLPTGYGLLWSGQYENMLRVKERLKVVLPLTLFIICLLLYMNTKSWIKTGLVLLAVPFSLIGAVWLLWALGYNISIAVWVGMIALMGLDAETGVFMLLFLDLSYKDAVGKGAMRNQKDLEEAIVHGAVKRVRPKLMTVMAAFMGLLPIMWATGAGADMMKRIAAPMVGGLFTSFILELLVYPAIYFLWKERVHRPTWKVSTPS
jgi:CzcA family heavy metal efflux pump